MAALESHLSRQAKRSASFFWQRLRFEAVARYFPKERFALLDVGAGAGLVGDYLGREVPRATYYFVEPIESLEAQLESRFGADRNAKKEQNFSRFDVITLLDVLEHQRDDQAFLRDLVAKMSPGATLVLTVPALQQLWSAWDVSLGHFRRYTRSTLEAVWRGAAVEVREVSYLFPEMVPLGLLRRARWPADEPLPADRNEFPDLPAWLNSALLAVGRVSLGARRFAPAGSSLLACLRRVARS